MEEELEEEIEEVCENCIFCVYQAYFDSSVCTDNGHNVFAPEKECCDEFRKR